MKRSFIREILEHTQSDTISFAGGLPDSTLFPHLDLRDAATEVLSDPQTLQYSTSTGLHRLRSQIAQHYSDQGFPTQADEIMITSGSQQALDILCRYYSGETIAIESPCYLGARNIFTLNKMQIDPIPLEADGIELEHLSKSLERSTLAYLNPDFQNPTGTCYSHDKRVEIASYFQKHQKILIEDAPYSQLYFDKAMQSISSMLPQHSYHLGSFSKVLAPALRIGWIRADQSLLTPLIPYIEAMDLHSSSLTQHIISAYLSQEHRYRAHLHRLRASYAQKMHYFAKELERTVPHFQYELPKGGMFIYGRFPDIDTMELVAKAMQEGVVFVPASEFGGAYDALRFNFTHSSFEEIKEGLERIAKCTTKAN